MDNQYLTVSDEEINALKKEIENKKRFDEYQKLKNDLFEINFKANNTLNEFQGGMKQVDAERVLKDNKSNQTLADVIISRFIKMCSLRPVSGNLIGIGLALIAIISLHYYLGTKDLLPLVMIVTYTIEAGIGVQILKSANRSLVLPIFSTIFMMVALINLNEGQSLFLHPLIFYKIGLLVSIIALTISVFSID